MYDDNDRPHLIFGPNLIHGPKPILGPPCSSLLLLLSSLLGLCLIRFSCYIWIVCWGFV